MKRLVTGCLCSVLAACLAAAAPQSAPATVNGSVSRVSDWAPPAVRIPTGLISDAGDREALLEWNPGLEKTLAGYFVYRQDAKGQAFRKVNAKPLAASEFADKNLINGSGLRYRVTAVLKSGVESKPSTEVQVVPRGVLAPVVQQGAVDLNVPGFDRIAVRNAISVRFENGHSIVFDTDMARLRDWEAAEGTHLLYPLPYGNPVDLTQMSEFGFPQASPATAERPALPPSINLDYGRRPSRGGSVWIGYTVRGDHITFNYRIPLTGPGMPPGSTGDLWVWATIWETWSPAERKISGGSLYKGLVRKIEMELPSYYKEGYSVCLNDGFGVNGSSDRAFTYEIQWSGAKETYLRTTQWRKGQDGRGAGRPRQTREFHPSSEATQVIPFLFARYPEGALVLAPRRYYYATTYSWTNYAAQGKDGLWPNYTIDTAASGRRTSIESFEYLWAPDTSLQAPQQYMDAAFHYRRQLADLYGLNRNLTSLDYAWDYWGPGRAAVQGKTLEQSLGILREWGAKTAQQARQAGADQLGGAHELWTSSPYTVGDEIRLNPDHAVNRAIADMISAFAKEQIRFGYWVRPEFVKQPLPNVLSERFFTPYYGYVQQYFPPASPIVEREGLKLIRQHPEWIRLGRGGLHPMRTPYNWTPMSLTQPGWYEEVVYKDLVMMRKLGYSSVLQDGGFSCLTGVDYTGGQAQPVQPYYWRFYQDMAQLGMDLNGECMTGWGNNNLGTPKPEDMKALWALVHTMYRGNRDGAALQWHTPELRHRSHQLYVGCYLNLAGAPGNAVVARFAQKFLRENGHPDRVFLEGLRWDETAQQWVWKSVWWEYADGRRVRYPDYAEVM